MHELIAEAVAPLLAKIAELEDEIARLKRNSGNSSKPPSSDIVKPPKSKPTSEKRRGRKPRRKKGGQPGHKKHERKPFDPSEIDHVVKYELPLEERSHLTPLDDWRIIQQVELVDKPFVVTEHRARGYRDERTGKIITAEIPPEVIKAGLVGPRLSAVAAYQKSVCHMSYSTIHRFWRDIADLPISRGQFAKVVGKASQALKAPYDELRAALASQNVLGIDESGHKDSGKRHWTWCFRANDFTLFHIDPSRGSQVLKDVLGETFGGVIGCDYFSAYHKYMKDAGVAMQFCMAHLIREIRFLAEHANKSLARWGDKLMLWIRKLFKTLHRRDEMTAAGFERSMGRIRKDFLKAVRRPPGVSEARTLAGPCRLIPNGIRHSDLREAVEDFASQPGFGFLILYNSIFQFDAKRIFDPIHGSLSKRTTMIADFLFPSFTTFPADLADRLISRERLFARIAVLLDLCVLLRRNNRRNVSSFECGVNVPGVVSAIARKFSDFHVAINLLQQVVDRLRIMHTVFRQKLGDYLLSIWIDRQMQLSPRPTLALAMRSRLPFAFAVNLQPGAVDHHIDRSATVLRKERTPHIGSTFCERRKVGDPDVSLHQLNQRFTKPFGLAVRQSKQLPQDEQRFDCRVAIDERSSTFLLLVLVFPLLDRLVGEPERNVTSRDQRVVVLRPICDLVRFFRRFRHLDYLRVSGCDPCMQPIRRKSQAGSNYLFDKVLWRNAFAAQRRSTTSGS